MKAVISIVYDKLTNPTGLLPRPTIALFYSLTPYYSDPTHQSLDSADT